MQNLTTSAGRTAVYFLVTAYFSSLGTVRHIHLRTRNILLLHENLIVHLDTLIDNAMVEGGSPLGADLEEIVKGFNTGSSICSTG